MSEDKRDQLGMLRYELNFIGQGGYGKRFGSCGASIFEDSLTCPNHGDPICRHVCHECLLYDFVPEEHRTDDTPCHHIPLDRSGLAVSTPNQTKDELCNDVVHWLKRTITRIEEDSIKMSRTIAA